MPRQLQQQQLLQRTTLITITIGCGQCDSITRQIRTTLQDNYELLDLPMRLIAIAQVEMHWHLAPLMELVNIARMKVHWHLARLMRLILNEHRISSHCIITHPLVHWLLGGIYIQTGATAKTAPLHVKMSQCLQCHIDCIRIGSSEQAGGKWIHH
jgi:hypothetical protein